MIYIIREEFDEEKEPDGMLLSGWTQPPLAAEKENESVNNGASTSDTSAAVMEAEKDDEIRVVTPGKKRKLPESSTTISGSDLPSAGDGTRNHSQLQVIDDEDDLVMLDDGNSDSFKKKRLQ